MSRPTAFSFIHFLESGLRGNYSAIRPEDFERMVDFEVHKASIFYRSSSDQGFKRDFSLVCREITGESTESFVFEARLKLKDGAQEEWLWFIQNEGALKEAADQVLNLLKAHEADTEIPLLKASEKEIESAPALESTTPEEAPIEGAKAVSLEPITQAAEAVPSQRTESASIPEDAEKTV